MKIVKKAVEKLPVPAAVAAYYWDEELPGFGVRVNPNGRKVYVCRYRVRGSRAQRAVTIAPCNVFTPDQAREKAKAIFHEVAQGGDPQGDRAAIRSAPTISELMDRFMREWAVPRCKPSTQASYEHMIGSIINPRFGSVKVREFQQSHVLRFQSEYGKDHPIGCNRAFAVISKAMNLAEVWGLRPKNSNPCKGLQKFKENARDKIMTAEQLLALWRALEEVDKERWRCWQITWLVRLLILTGAREGEIMKARWEHVNWERKTLTLFDSKTGPGEIDLSDEAIEVLKAIPRFDKCHWILPGRNKNDHMASPWDAWRKITKRAGIEGFWLHDLRHNYASAAHEMGLSVKAIQGQLRHKTMLTTMRYINLLDQQKKKDAKLVGKGFAALLGLKASDEATQ